MPGLIWLPPDNGRILNYRERVREEHEALIPWREVNFWGEPLVVQYRGVWLRVWFVRASGVQGK